MVDANMLNKLLRTQYDDTGDKGGHDLEAKEGLIVFQNVTTADEGGAKLSGISFTAKPGSTVACVGEVNSGTGLLLKSLIGSLAIESGSILIDGQDTQELATSSLRASISLVSKVRFDKCHPLQCSNYVQDPILFNGTIMSNLKYANLNASDDSKFSLDPL